MDLNTLFKGRFCCFPKDPLEEAETWGESVDKLLGCKCKDKVISFYYIACLKGITKSAKLVTEDIGHRKLLLSVSN